MRAMRMIFDVSPKKGKRMNEKHLPLSHLPLYIVFVPSHAFLLQHGIFQHSRKATPRKLPFEIFPLWCEGISF